MNADDKNSANDRHSASPLGGFVQVRAARLHNLRAIDVDIPRNRLVVFTGVSGSGKSSLAFGTIYAEAQRRYFESIAPYTRRLMEQLPAPQVGDIHGLPPAVALHQRRGEATVRSSVGTITTLSNSLRMLMSRAGTYPQDATERIDSDAFSPNTAAGACPRCHGMGVTHEVTEESLVPDPNLSIRDGAIAAWPGAWQGKNLRDILGVLGYDLDKPWNKLSKKDRKWILFTDEKPVVTVHAIREAHRIQRPYQGTYQSAANYVRHTFATTGSASLRKRAAQFMETSKCVECHGKRLNRKSLAVKFAGYDIAELGEMSLSRLASVLSSSLEKLSTKSKSVSVAGENAAVASVIVEDLQSRIALLSQLGLDYLSLDRATNTLSAGELQRLRFTSLIRSGLFGVIYVLDEPSAGLHPSDSDALMSMLRKLMEGGNSLFIVEHDMEIVRHADWIVDIGPGAGDNGGRLLYSGPVPGLAQTENSLTRRYLFNDHGSSASAVTTFKTERSSSKIRHLNDTRTPLNWMRFKNVSKNNIENLTVEFPLALLTVVTGVSGSGKSSLVSQFLAESMQEKLGLEAPDDESSDGLEKLDLDREKPTIDVEGIESIKRLVVVDQKPIGRTPRSNLATYTGLFDAIRQRFAATDEAKAKKFNAGRFSFNVAGGRCDTCEGEGFVSVELMFLPTVYSPCAACGGTRYNRETLSVKYRDLNIAQVLDMTVDTAAEFFTEIPSVARALTTLREVGLGYLRIGQPATELSGGEAQRIKLSTELQRVQKGNTLYLLDEPTTGLHPADVEKLMHQLHGLVDAGNTVILIEHDLDVILGADWVIDLGPGAGEKGGKIVAKGTPKDIVESKSSLTAKYLSARMSISKDFDSVSLKVSS